MSDDVVAGVGLDLAWDRGRRCGASTTWADRPHRGSRRGPGAPAERRSCSAGRPRSIVGCRTIASRPGSGPPREVRLSHVNAAERCIGWCQLTRSSITPKRSLDGRPDLASTPGTHVTKRPTSGPVPSAVHRRHRTRRHHLQIMRTIGARSHTGSADRCPVPGRAKRYACGRVRKPGSSSTIFRRAFGTSRQDNASITTVHYTAQKISAIRDILLDARNILAAVPGIHADSRYGRIRSRRIERADLHQSHHAVPTLPECMPGMIARR